MSKEELFEEVRKLSFNERVSFIEEVLKSIRKEGLAQEMTKASESLSEYYKNSSEATEFTDLDQDDFYEPKLNLVGKPRTQCRS